MSSDHRRESRWHSALPFQWMPVGCVAPEYVAARPELFKNWKPCRVVDDETIELRAKPENMNPRTLLQAWQARDSVRVIQVRGFLQRDPSRWLAEAGGTSYVELAEEIDDAAADDESRGIVLQFDSPGGCGLGLDPARAAVLDAVMKKKFVAAHVKGRCEGAALLLALACDGVFCDPTARLGSLAFTPTQDLMGGEPSIEPLGNGLERCGAAIRPAGETARRRENLEELCIERTARELIFSREARPRLRNVSLIPLLRKSVVAEQAIAMGVADELLPLDALIERMVNTVRTLDLLESNQKELREVVGEFVSTCLAPGHATSGAADGSGDATAASGKDEA